jgi:hypothetical protein
LDCDGARPPTAGPPSAGIRDPHPNVEE